MRRQLVMSGLAGLLVLASPATAQGAKAEPGLPEAYQLEDRAGWVNGYRSALFGMDAAAVRTAVRADFGEAVVAETVLPTGDIYVDLAGVEDDRLGKVSVRYIILAASGLAAVNMLRAGEGPTPAAARADVLAASARFAAGTLGLRWAPFALQTGIATGDGGRIAMRTHDLNGNGLELRLEGIADGAGKAGSAGRSATGIAQPRLSLSYVRDLASLMDIGAEDY